MNKLKLMGWKLVQIINSRRGRACLCHAILLITKTARNHGSNSSNNHKHFTTTSGM